jgi:hypothetical protein
MLAHVGYIRPMPFTETELYLQKFIQRQIIYVINIFGFFGFYLFNELNSSEKSYNIICLICAKYVSIATILLLY